MENVKLKITDEALAVVAKEALKGKQEQEVCVL